MSRARLSLVHLGVKNSVIALDPRTGALLWHDALKGLGTGPITVASDLGGSSNSPALAQAQMEAQSRAATTAATV